MFTTTYQPKPAIRPVSPPRQPLPSGAWDTHAHVFGPFERYPVLEARRYDPPLAPAADYLRMLDVMGFARGVLVHASANGYDNRTTGDALTVQPGRVLGVGVVSPETPDAELERMHAQGFRALRFTVTGARSQQFAGSLDFADLRAFAPRLKALGWHAQLWVKCDLVVAAAKELQAYGIPIVFDHMGYFEPEKGVADGSFQSFLSMLGDGDFWVKTTPIRLTKTDPTWQSIRPFHDALVQRAPSRLLWGSDWPYLSMDAKPLDPGHLVDLFDDWTRDAGLRQRVFVDNPRRLYER